MFQLFLQAGSLDLARDRLQVVLDQTQPGDFTPEVKAQYDQQLEQLNQRVNQIEEALLDLQVERQAGPIEKALYARGQGAPGLAIGELEEAERGNMSPVIVKPQLVDLYCNTGQPDRALELLSLGANEDTTLGQEPGSSFLRQGQVYLLLGNYLSAASLWRERAIPRLRFDRSMRALSLGQVLGRGDLITAANTDMSLPPLINRQAYWEYELGQCLLESGSPDQAAEYFTRALKLVPDLAVRPIIAYYLEKMGKPVPELPKKVAPEPSTAKTPVDQLLQRSLPAATPVGALRPATPPPASDAAKSSSGSTPAARPAEVKKP